MISAGVLKLTWSLKMYLKIYLDHDGLIKFNIIILGVLKIKWSLQVCES